MAVTVSIFAYGTLLVPEVMQAVTGTHFKSSPAILKGYQRYKIINRSFPGIIKDETASVDGVVYLDIDEQSLHMLDQFEDICYERVEEEITVNGVNKNAFVYKVTDKCKGYLSDEEWSLEEFKSNHLNGYLNRI